MDDIERAKMHSAGATIIHHSPFESVEVFTNEEELTEEFIKKWVVPFYMNLFSVHKNESMVNDLSAIKNEISPEIIKMLLGDFNWRTRITGAFFAALTNAVEFDSEIGKLLIKSELCFVGNEYCTTLAIFNTENSIQFINQYLDYYLTRKDLQFNQSSAISALVYLDKVNGTNYLEKHEKAICEFFNYKPGFVIDEKFTGEGIKNRIKLIEEINKNLE